MSKYFFLHIPKTAGTSFRNMLFSIFNQSEILPNTKIIKSYGKYPPLQSLKTEFKEEIQTTRLLVGHYPLITSNLLGSDVHKLIFFRDPVDRVISLLNHFKRHKEEYYNYNLDQIFNSESRQTSNHQVKLLSKGFVKEGQQRLDIAIKNLNNFDFIGITEDYKDSIILAEKIFNWDLGKVRTDNITFSKGEISDDLLDKITQNNSLDIKLYNAVKIKYNILCKKHKVK